MRLTVELILAAPRYTSPLNEREILLRSLHLSSLEHLGAMGEEIESMDISNNQISSLDNIPLLPRLRTIIAANNKIKSIAEGLGCKNLLSLNLFSNYLSSLSMIDRLSSLFPSLSFLVLLKNPLSSHPLYRLYTLFRLPSLRSLDYSKVTEKEKKQAKEFFASTEGKKALKAIDDTSLASSLSLPSSSSSSSSSSSAGGGGGGGAKGKSAMELEEKKKESREVLEARRAELLKELDKAEKAEDLNRIENELNRIAAIIGN